MYEDILGRLIKSILREGDNVVILLRKDDGQDFGIYSTVPPEGLLEMLQQALDGITMVDPIGG